MNQYFLAVIFIKPSALTYVQSSFQLLSVPASSLKSSSVFIHWAQGYISHATHLHTCQTVDIPVTTDQKQLWTVLQRISPVLHRTERGYWPLQSSQLPQRSVQWDAQRCDIAQETVSSWGAVQMSSLLHAWCHPCSCGGRWCSLPPPAVPGRSHWASDTGSCPELPVMVHAE